MERVHIILEVAVAINKRSKIKNNMEQNRSNRKIKNILYQCPECSLWYDDEEWKNKCETWCKEHQSCNLEIISHAVKSSG